jgi:hypothetical protein
MKVLSQGNIRTETSLVLSMGTQLQSRISTGHRSPPGVFLGEQESKKEQQWSKEKSNIREDKELG